MQVDASEHFVRECGRHLPCWVPRQRPIAAVRPNGRSAASLFRPRQHRQSSDRRIPQRQPRGYEVVVEADDRLAAGCRNDGEADCVRVRDDLIVEPA